ncbi:SCO4225 family membrane protein [Streptomyces sioyaensis]|uniref:SCO4225 family membrane protein n=1 Tax=Streptomyces sioyaensis TaxID=67364 RepID=UPI0037997D75
MNSRRLKSIARLTFGNRASQIYLALVAAAAVEFLVDHGTYPFAGILLLFVSMPTIFVFMGVEGLSGLEVPYGSTHAYVVASILIQSLLIGALASRVRTWFRARTQGTA